MIESHHFSWLALVVSIYLFYQIIAKKRNTPNIFFSMFGKIAAPYAYQVFLGFLSLSFLLFFVHFQGGFVLTILLMMLAGTGFLCVGLYHIHFALFPNSPKAMTLSDEVVLLGIFRFRSKGITRLGVLLIGIVFSVTGSGFFFGSIAGYYELQSLGLLKYVE